MKSVINLSCGAILLLMIAANSVSAQTGLGIQIYPGTNITGSIGGVYSFQATTNIGNPAGWSTVAVVQLTTTNYVWFDTSFPANPQRYYRTVAFTNILTNMVFISAGTFVMGSPTNEALRDTEGIAIDETQHTVTLTKGFYMGKYLVTQSNYLAVTGKNPSAHTGSLNYPVEQVSFSDATNYCLLRTAQEQIAKQIPTNWTYRLPTESEWEYACRAGTTAAFYLGSGLHSGLANFKGTNEYDSSVGLITNTNGVYLTTTTNVGSYSANGWGLYDMAGNLWEWVQDYYAVYPSGNVTDPQGATSGAHIIRGGSFASSASSCRSASRIQVAPTGDATPSTGFRVVLVPSQ